MTPADASGFIDGLNASQPASDAFSTPNAGRAAATMGASAPPALHFSALSPCADAGCGCGLTLPVTTTAGAPTMPQPVVSVGAPPQVSGPTPPLVNKIAGDGDAAVQSMPAPEVGDAGGSTAMMWRNPRCRLSDVGSR